MKKCVINMLSRADTVQGHGVLSAYCEQVALVSQGLTEEFSVVENSYKHSDILHIHTVNLPFYLRCVFKRPDVASVGYVHYIPETLDQSIKLPPVIKEIFYWYVVHFYKQMDHLVTVNPCFIEKLVALGIEREKITYIPNFVSDERFHAVSAADKRALREQYKLGPDGFVVLSVGQLQKRKGVLEFIELAKEMPEVTFLWAGGFSFGKISDGYEEIQYILQNPPANVKFMGLIPRERMNEVYNLADVLFQPSFDELFPMTTLESMCVGLPLLLRDLDLYKDILFDYYLKGNTTAEFKQLLTRLMDADYYQEASARSKAGHHFYSHDAVLAQWQSYYEGVAEDCRQISRQTFRMKLKRRFT